MWSLLFTIIEESCVIFSYKCSNPWVKCWDLVSNKIRLKEHIVAKLIRSNLVCFRRQQAGNPFPSLCVCVCVWCCVLLWCFVCMCVACQDLLTSWANRIGIEIKFFDDSICFKHLHRVNKWELIAKPWRVRGRSHFPLQHLSFQSSWSRHSPMLIEPDFILSLTDRAAQISLYFFCFCSCQTVSFCIRSKDTSDMVRNTGVLLRFNSDSGAWNHKKTQNEPVKTWPGSAGSNVYSRSLWDFLGNVPSFASSHCLPSMACRLTRHNNIARTAVFFSIEADSTPD